MHDGGASVTGSSRTIAEQKERLYVSLGENGGWKELPVKKTYVYVCIEQMDRLCNHGGMCKLGCDSLLCTKLQFRMYVGKDRHICC